MFCAAIADGGDVSGGYRSCTSERACLACSACRAESRGRRGGVRRGRGRRGRRGPVRVRRGRPCRSWRPGVARARRVPVGAGLTLAQGRYRQGQEVEGEQGDKVVEARSRGNKMGMVRV